MDAQKTRQIGLLIVLALNVVSTMFHYTDNALFLNQYPGPEWFTPAVVLIAWFTMTPFGLVGYWLYTKELFWAAYLCLSFYSITSVASPGHYLFPAIAPFSLKMHTLIWFDALAGLALISFILWSGLFLKEWRKNVT